MKKLQREKGIVSTIRAKKSYAIVRSEIAIKSLVKELDGMRCRWPDCDISSETFWGALEAAHYKAEGMGGDPTLERCTPENLIACCKFHHRGPFGLHSGLAQMEPLTDRGMRGPVQFSRMEKGESGKWYVVGVTEPPRLNDGD